MKASTITATAIVFLSGANFCGVQADPTEHRARSKTFWQDDQERYVHVTGSNIPQKLIRKSIGTTTPYNLRIYTRDELETTGRQTVAGALSIDPSIQISSRGR